MKKWIAAILAVFMLFSACSFAEGQGIVINNIQLDLGGGDVLDLSGIDLGAGYFQDEARNGVYLALSGNGEDIVRVNLAADEEKLLAAITGLSDLYSFPMEGVSALSQVPVTGVDSLLQANSAASESQEDTMALMGITMQVMGAITGGLSDGGTTEIEGTTYAVTDIIIPEDAVDAILGSVASYVDTKPEILNSLGISSASQLLAEMGMKFSVEGYLLASEKDSVLDLYLTAADAATGEASTVEIYGVMTPGAEAVIEGMTATDYTVVVAPEVDGEYVEALSVTVSLHADAVTGEPTAAVCGLFVPVDVTESGETVYKAYYMSLLSPAAHENNMWQIAVYDDEQMFYTDFRCGVDADGVTNANAYFAVENEGIDISYSGKDGKGQLGVAASVQGINCGLTADIASSEVDDSWLPVDNGAAVSILDLAEAANSGEVTPELEKLLAEAQALLMNAIYGLAAANESIGALIGGMMMG